MKLFSFWPTLSSHVALLALVLTLAGGALVASAQDGETDEEAVTLFNQGQDAHQKGDFKAAIVAYEKALKLAPSFPEAELQRGNALTALGRLDEAETAFRNAVQLREDWSLAWATLGDVLVRKQKFAEADDVLTKAIELDGMNFPAYAAITELRLRTNAKPEERTKLLATLRILTSKASPTAGIWVARGALENSLNDRASAKTSLNAALKLDPTNVGALSESAALALSENDPSLAAVYLARLEAIAPASVGVKLLRARVLFANGRVADAIGQLDEITSSPEADQLRKDILSSTSVDVSELVKQLANEPKNAIVLGKLCSLLRVKEPMKALEYCRQAVSADPTRIENAIGFGAALIQAKRFDDAIVVFRRLGPLAPDNSTVRTNLATALFFAKRYAEAKIEFRWLTDNQPNLAVAYYFLAIAHDHLGEYSDAMANYQQFLRLADPKSTLEIEKVNLRLPGLQKQIRNGKGKKSY